MREQMIETATIGGYNDVIWVILYAFIVDYIRPKNIRELLRYIFSRFESRF